LNPVDPPTNIKLNLAFLVLDLQRFQGQSLSFLQEAFLLWIYIHCGCSKKCCFREDGRWKSLSSFPFLFQFPHWVRVWPCGLVWVSLLILF